MLCLAAQLCLTLCDLMTAARQAPPSMVILQARILEWVAMPSSRGSSQPRDWTQVLCIAGGFFTIWDTRGSPKVLLCNTNCKLIISKVGLSWNLGEKKKKGMCVFLLKNWLLCLWRLASPKSAGEFSRLETSGRVGGLKPKMVWW